MIQLQRRPRKTPPETIIALIDVVFFLLVFFMLIGRMDATAPFDVQPALAITGADMPAGGVTVSVSQSGLFAFDGIEMTSVETERAVSEALAQDPTILVRVNAHKDAKLETLLPLVARIEALGAQDVVLVVTPEGT